MDEVDYNAEFSLLLNEMQDPPEDAHEIHMRLKQMISTMRAEGLPVPEDFKQLEARLDKELTANAEEVQTASKE